MSTRFDDVSVEERLRDATRAYTDAIEPAPDAWARFRTNIDEPRVLPLPRRRGAVVIAAAIAVAVAIVVLVGVVTLPGVDRRSVQTPLRPAPTPPASTVAPLVEGPDAASTLLDSWGRFHVGFVFVYGDGRVIWTNDGNEMSIKERRLSRRGLDLVRNGTLDPEQFVVTHEVRKGGVVIEFAQGVSGVFRRQRLWAEPTARVYEPSKFAICPSSRDGTLFGRTLPASAWKLLDGKQHSLDPGIGLANWPDARSNFFAPPQDCFEVTATEASTLTQILEANGWESLGGALTQLPLLPHGQPVPQISG